MASLSAINILRPSSLSSYNPSSPLLSPPVPGPSYHRSASSMISFASSNLDLRPLRAVSTDVLTDQKPLSPTSLLVTREEALNLYEDMLLARRFEEKCDEMYNLGKMFGYVHLYIGEEAVAAGFIKLLTQRDAVGRKYLGKNLSSIEVRISQHNHSYGYENFVYKCTYRDHVHALCKGVPPRPMMAELFGRTTGLCRGQGCSMHMFYRPCNFLGGFGFIGEGIPIATGAAFNAKFRHDVLKESKPEGFDVAIVFLGDGTSNIGQFFECLNMAQLWKLPVIFVVENNRWSLRAIWKKGPAFGMPGVRVGGMDIIKVTEVAKAAIARARRGAGPTLVECDTYRFKGHSMYDKDEEDQRDPDERAHYAARDPIMALKKHILEQYLASESELKVIDEKIYDVVKDAVEFADSSPHPPRNQLLENVFADPKGFGIGPDGKYRCEDPNFAAGTAGV